MREPRGRLRLALGARARAGVVRRDALDGDDAVEALVVREPHDAEAARPEAPQEPVATEDEPVPPSPSRRRVARPAVSHRVRAFAVRSSAVLTGSVSVRRPAVLC